MIEAGRGNAGEVEGREMRGAEQARQSGLVENGRRDDPKGTEGRGRGGGFCTVDLIR